MKYTKDYGDFLNESSNRDYALTLHAMTNCGIDAAENFLDENKVKVEKLISDIRNGVINKWDAARGINGSDHPKMLKIFNKKYVKR